MANDEPNEVVGHTTGWDPLEWSVWAMNAAAGRLNDTHWHDPHLAFASLGETLWWVVAVDELLRKRYGEATHNQAMENADVKNLHAGLRYARNRFAHDGDVLEYVAVNSVTGGLGLEMTAHWAWSELSKIEGRGERGQEEYHELLASNLVPTTLNTALVFLRAQAWASATARRMRPTLDT